MTPRPIVQTTNSITAPVASNMEAATRISRAQRPQGVQEEGRAGDENQAERGRHQHAVQRRQPKRSSSHSPIRQVTAVKPSSSATKATVITGTRIATADADNRHQDQCCR